MSDIREGHVAGAYERILSAASLRRYVNKLCRAVPDLAKNLIQSCGILMKNSLVA